jgi:hypothetical protein
VRFLVVGNPSNRRLTAFAEAVQAAGHQPELVAWLDLLQGRADLTSLTENAVVKLDSPGEDLDVERELIALGARVEEREHQDAAAIDAPAALALGEDQGRIRYPRQWYRGFCRVLERCAEALAMAPPRLLLNHPSAIATQFDKPSCHTRLLEAGVAVAPALPTVGSYAELRDAMHTAGWSRVFVKLSWGSSASGVVALETRPGAVQAHTTVELVQEDGHARLYNSLRVRRMTDEVEVATVVDALAREGVHVERWLPKASIDGKTFDLRLLVLSGRACHAVVRASHSPLTNLHLGNVRGDLGAVRERLGAEGWAALEDQAVRACAPFPSLYAGVDVLVTSSWRAPFVVELNAFGDLLPGLTHEGKGCYASQISEALRRVH